MNMKEKGGWNGTKREGKGVGMEPREKKWKGSWNGTKGEGKWKVDWNGTSLPSIFRPIPSRPLPQNWDPLILGGDVTFLCRIGGPKLSGATKESPA